MRVCACVCALETCTSGCRASAGGRPTLSSLSGALRGAMRAVPPRPAFRADRGSALTGAGVKWPVTATVLLLNGGVDEPSGGPGRDAEWGSAGWGAWRGCSPGLHGALLGLFSHLHSCHVIP